MVGKRVALVIGNGEYVNARKLKNPANDAVAIAESLRALGFECDGPVLDASWDSFDQAVLTFSEKLEGADIAVFFFAGHSIQVESINYLLPIDADLKRKSGLKRHAFALDSIIDALKTAPRTLVVLLDGCRDNPFAGGLFAGDNPARAITVPPSGPAQVTLGSRNDVCIFFATSEGKSAKDSYNNGNIKIINSPFSASLLNHISTEGLTFQAISTRVINNVLDLTNHDQRPWLLSSMSKEIFLRPKVSDLVQPPSPTPSPPQKPDVEPDEKRHGGDRVSDAGDGGRDDPQKLEPPPKPWHQTNWAKSLAIVAIVAVGSLFALAKYWQRPAATDLTVPSALWASLLDSRDEKRATAALEALTKLFAGSEGTGPRGREAATSLARMAQNVSFMSLSEEGRKRVVSALRLVPQQAWAQPDWQTARAFARRAVTDFATQRGIDITSDPLAKTLRLGTHSCGSFQCTPFPHYATITAETADNVRRSLMGLGWLMQANDSEATASGASEVRFGLVSDREQASLLAADLIALGFTTTAAKQNTTIRPGKIESWIGVAPSGWSTTKPTAAWCYQEERGVTGSGAYLAACHEAKTNCEKALQGVARRTTGCWFVGDIPAVAWSPAAGGLFNSWYQYDASPRPAPFPQFDAP